MPVRAPARDTRVCYQRSHAVRYACRYYDARTSYAHALIFMMLPSALRDTDVLTKHDVDLRTARKHCTRDAAPTAAFMLPGVDGFADGHDCRYGARRGTLCAQTVQRRRRAIVTCARQRVVDARSDAATRCATRQSAAKHMLISRHDTMTHYDYHTFAHYRLRYYFDARFLLPPYFWRVFFQLSRCCC